MTPLFRRIQPSKKLRITVRSIAQLLKISPYLIKRVESWANVVFVHRRDRGGQFISYRKLQEWQNSIGRQIQNCANLSELSQLAASIRHDSRSFKKQYCQQTLDFLQQTWIKRQDTLESWENLNSCAS